MHDFWFDLTDSVFESEVKKSSRSVAFVAKEGGKKIRRQHWFHCQAQTEEEEEEEEEEEALTAADRVRERRSRGCWFLEER
jgi:hypothetical protein